MPHVTHRASDELATGLFLNQVRGLFGLDRCAAIAVENPLFQEYVVVDLDLVAYPMVPPCVSY